MATAACGRNVSGGTGRGVMLERWMEMDGDRVTQVVFQQRAQGTCQERP